MTIRGFKQSLALLALAIFCGGVSAQAQPDFPWMNSALSPDARAALLEKAMTPTEKLALVHGLWIVPHDGFTPPPGSIPSAGYIAGVTHLGLPALKESDASLGVANYINMRPGDGATALPSSIALAATFDPDTAYAGGAMIAHEAWSKGFNVLLAGGANLARDPRNGRNFEYLGEDPLLAGIMDGASIRGIQDQHVISTAKHFALNDQETHRHNANAVIDEAAMRESDLLAFEFAIETGKPGSVMCSYNLVNGAYACDNDKLLDGILKGDWKYPGWVMSDWGAVYNPRYALAGLDQESGEQLDPQVFFGAPLQAMYKAGTLPPARLNDMVRRILRSMFAVGVFDHPPIKTAIDDTADAQVARHEASQAIVLLKNDGAVLPLSRQVKHIAVIGGHADVGVLSGGGSSQVAPTGGFSALVPVDNQGGMAAFRNAGYEPSAPLAAITAKLPDAEVRYDNGRYPSSAARLAKWADVVVVFATQWMAEDTDAPDLSLPDGQDALIAAVAEANPHTIVVLETGGPVEMPWADKSAAILEAWYPGQKGGEAIADILFGDVNPSGHLPVTFPQSIAQNPRPALPGADVPDNIRVDVPYTEGANIGYRWFAAQNLVPLFAFGHGLSYTHFSIANLVLHGGKTLTADFDITNSGAVAGDAVPQLYLTAAAGEKTQRLIGFQRMTLTPGQTRHVQLTADPRLLSHYDIAKRGWQLAGGTYQVSLGQSAADAGLTANAEVTGALLPP